MILFALLKDFVITSNCLYTKSVTATGWLKFLILSIYLQIMFGFQLILCTFLMPAWPSLSKISAFSSFQHSTGLSNKVGYLLMEQLTNKLCYQMYKWTLHSIKVKLNFPVRMLNLRVNNFESLVISSVLCSILLEREILSMPLGWWMKSLLTVITWVPERWWKISFIMYPMRHGIKRRCNRFNIFP